MPTTPTLEQRSAPGLSRTLTHERHPERCQSCGVAGEQDGEHTKRIRRWRECDEWDKPTRVVVALCATCSKRLIDPHPKLYIPIEADEPDPGSMPTCVGCAHRQGLRCRSPLLKANGGPGLPMTHPKPTWMHVCGTRGGRRTGWTTTTYHGAVTCNGRSVAVLAAPSSPEQSPR